MSVLILDNRIEGEAVRVTAVDYNHALPIERAFDGNPFSMGPEWLVEALLHEKITVYPDDRDYACWKILTPHGEVIAEPGDIIMHQRGVGLTVYTKKTGK
jgi:hypothetical protein